MGRQHAVEQIFCLILVLLSGFCRSQHNPHFKENRHVIVHLFEWKFSDVARECETFLGPKGFGGVQLSPVNENLVKNESYGRPWWERYQPISYFIQSRSGNQSEFLSMTQQCNKAGVRVYVDVVLNHMAAAHDENGTREMIGTGGVTANATKRYYPGVPYKAEEFHPECVIEDYTDGQQVRNCQLLTLPDLNQSLDSVQRKIVHFLNNLINLGAAGFRIDAAKHMWPNDINDILSQVKSLNIDFDFELNSKPFVYLEVIDLGGEAVSKTEYNGLGVVTEFLYSLEIGKTFNGQKPLSHLINWGPTMGFLPHSEALVFVDNHDNQRNHGAGSDSILTHKNPKKYEMAIAFMLSHPYGIKRLMSSYRFNSTDQGPPADEHNDIVSPVINNATDECVNGRSEYGISWVCEHRWNSIANMVEFLNVVEGQPISNWQDNGPNQIAFCRGNKGFIAFNNDISLDFKRRVVGCLKPGHYCDIISGNKFEQTRKSSAGSTTMSSSTTCVLNDQYEQCSGLELIVDADGYINVSLAFNGEHGVVAIHENSFLRDL